MRFTVKRFTIHTTTKSGLYCEYPEYNVTDHNFSEKSMVNITCWSRASARSLAHFLNQWDMINSPVIKQVIKNNKSVIKSYS